MKKILSAIGALLFPAKCILCQKLLETGEADLCSRCIRETPEYSPAKKSIPFVAQIHVLWYYKEDVRSSILRFKFRGQQSYARVYGKFLAEKLRREAAGWDVFTWIPISARRKRQRGYDQVELIARAIGQELGVTPVPALRKVRHNRPQSRLAGGAQRRANVLGVYQVADPAAIAGKRVLLLDDIITTGATVSEAARMLRTAGAKEVICCAVAAAGKPKN